MSRQRSVLFTYDRVSEESAAEGDTCENGWADLEGGRYPIRAEGMEPKGVEEIRAIAKEVAYPVASAREAVELIRDNMRSLEPSSWPTFHVGVWYTEEAEQDMQSGDYESKSAHLEGFDPREERAIWNALVGGRRGLKRATRNRRRT